MGHRFSTQGALVAWSGYALFMISIRPPNAEPDSEAVENTVLLLNSAGCPKARRGQGTDEFSAKMRPGHRTPDIVAGPLHGFGNPNDFYIDVQSPTGDYLIKDEVGAKRALELYEDALRTGVFKFPELDTGYLKRVLITPIEKKIEKYARSRSSALYGHVLYFDLVDGPAHLGIAALDHLSAAGAM